ncbi:hypothetical protein A6B43_04675 [Vespertiliibacter pulmonis]|uniref:Uncharacterized membrane protein YgaE (UPF0421/DUF939 family) n=1 Tax=Vespertiliibacter pulmonis TaxID=1443036 RepID=A0A3N4VWQ8_9PAST|nr:aromatic acid exporter family protein [Vespertiliibacter pulmonis]QLB20869.1 hypothetical protein A6B43_04675 [Vespertiliibacter pulmonis]RPE83521.1 uncharacterized membrane protein YgaE (UPF0421/DUF939 family) [Vespertiliibacter pulmonis]
MSFLTNNTAIRVVKLTLGTILAIHLADILGLHYSFSAGIIAMLSIMDTRLLTLKIAFQRLMSLVLGLILGVGLFYYFGYSLEVFAILLLIYIPLSLRFNLISGLVPSCVLLSHFINAKSVDVAIIYNAFGLMFVGLGVATLFNLYMPSYKKQIEQMQRQVEGLISHIMGNLAKQLALALGDKQAETQKLYQQLNAQLALMEKTVQQERENNLFSHSLFDVDYTVFRQSQAVILRYMIDNAFLIKFPQEDGKTLAEIFQLASQQINREIIPEALSAQLQAMFSRFRQYDLPTERVAFEERALIYQLMTDYQRFLDLKYNFVKKHYINQ